MNKDSWSNLGCDRDYELPKDLEEETDEARSYLAGEYEFKV
jgi:hypothetical protein